MSFLISAMAQSATAGDFSVDFSTLSSIFLILPSGSGVMLPWAISARSAPWVAARCSRNSASHLVILSTGIESSCEIRKCD